MDRLHAVAAPTIVVAFFVAAGCDADKRSAPSPPPPSRFDAVKAKKDDGQALHAFCDVTGPKDFQLPPVDAPPKEAGARRWLNVWATWCKPCIEEMPMLVQWQRKLAAAGLPLSLEFLSVDAERETVAEFRKQHPQTPASMHLADPEALSPWLTALGLDAGAGLPVHVFVDAGKIRCVRAGAITERHYDLVVQLLRGK